MEKLIRQHDEAMAGTVQLRHELTGMEEDSTAQDQFSDTDIPLPMMTSKTSQLVLAPPPTTTPIITSQEDAAQQRELKSPTGLKRLQIDQ